MADNLWKHPKSKLLYVRIMQDGRRRLFPTGTQNKTQARKAAEAIKTDLRRGKLGFEKEEKPVTLKELCDRFLEWAEVNHKSYESDVAYTHNLIRFFGQDIHIQKITAWDVEKFKKARIEKVKPSTVNHDIKCLKQMYKMANEEWGFTKVNPTLKTKKLQEDNQRLRFLSDDERRRLLEACAEGPWYLLPVVQTAINTGMRRGEILGLEWKDLSIEKSIIRVAKSKSGKPRVIPMNSLLVDMFNSLKREESKMFPVDGFKKSWKSALKRANIDDLRFHDLRHECASQLVMSGADLKVVQEVLGHSDLRVTQRYAHISQEHKQIAMERLVALQRKPASEETGKVVQLRKID